MAWVRFFVISVWLIALLFFPAAALADGTLEPPCRFYGTVKVDGAEVSDGTPIIAMIQGEVVASTTTPYLLGPSTYSILIEQPEGANYSNADVTFIVGVHNATQTRAWVMGKNEKLNLTAFSPSTPTPTPKPTLTPTSTPPATPAAGLGTGTWVGIGIGIFLAILLVLRLGAWLVRR